MNKKNIVFVILLVIFTLCGVFIGRQSKVIDVYENNETNIKKSKNMLSMMLETEAGSGNYEMTTRESWPTEGYIFNTELSKCENGGELSWDDTNKIVLMSGNVSDKCYVYFDMIPSVLLADFVISQYNGIQGNNNIYYHDSSLTNGAKDNSYRYAGSSDTTNNYVCFASMASPCPEDNLYRIIGVFDRQVKLIKATLATSDLLGTDGPYYGYNKYGWTSLSSCSTDVAYNNVNVVIPLANKNIIAAPMPSGNIGCNEWKYSELNKTNLNTNYLNNVGTTWSNMIEDTTWKVSGIATDSTPSAIYTEEITNASKTYGPSDGTSKIGLMYASDYAFAAAPSAWTKDSVYYNSSAVTSANWMYMGLDEWTISRDSNNTTNSFAIFSTGYLYTPDTQFNQESPYVRPTFYLNFDISYKSGSGTQSDPYRIN